MMVTCMNDPGDPGNRQRSGSAVPARSYSQFCYELPFMPGQTRYLDTPVVPTSAFAVRATTTRTAPTRMPRRRSAKSMATESGPWVSAAGKHSTIKALGDQL